MSDYIKREDALDNIRKIGKVDSWLPAAVSAVKECPPEDVAPIVRCKDCRYYQDNNGGYPNANCKWCKDETPDADDFCSCGERKGGE